MVFCSLPFFISSIKPHLHLTHPMLKQYYTIKSALWMYINLNWTKERSTLAAGSTQLRLAAWFCNAYTDEPKHYEHLPDVLLIFYMLPKLHRPTVIGSKSWRFDREATVEIGPAHPIGAWLNWDLENLKARETPWTPHYVHVPETIPGVRMHYILLKDPCWKTIETITEMPWFSLQYLNH